MSTIPCSEIAYTTRADAHAAIARIIKTHRAKKLSVYRCPFCELWHLSHQKQKIGTRTKKQLMGN